MKFLSRVTRILLATMVASQGAMLVPAMAASQGKQLAVKAIGMAELKSEFGAGGGGGGSGGPVVVDPGNGGGGNPSCQYNWNANQYCDWVDRNTITEVQTDYSDWIEFRDVGFPIISCDAGNGSTCAQRSYEASVAVAINIQFSVADPQGVYSGAVALSIQAGAAISASFENVPNGTQLKGFLKLDWQRRGGYYTAVYRDDTGVVGRFTVGPNWQRTTVASYSYTVLKRPNANSSWILPNRGY